MSTRDSSSNLSIGVGIDTARYGHHVTFLYENRQPAAEPITVMENAEGYQLLREQLGKLRNRFPDALFRVRIDAAGQYATNLERFLRELPFSMTISIGEPKRNKDYRAAISPKRNDDCTASHAMARYAVVEQPEATKDVPNEFFVLREIVARLQAQSRDTTRAVNRLHNLMSRVFPELATLVTHLPSQWVLHMLDKYPTPQRIAAARSLHKIPFIKRTKAEEIQAAARVSIGSLSGSGVEALVREGVRRLQECLAAEKRLQKLLEESFQELPLSGHIHVSSIPGIGAVTAAILVAKIIDIRRFATPEKLVGYFGIFPEKDSSGVQKNGEPVEEGAKHMSRKGSDIVRRYLWNAAKNAIRNNPAVRDLYARLRAKGTRGDVALGHCMRKLLHQVFGVWTGNQPFSEELSRMHRKKSANEGKDEPEEDKGMVAGHKRETCPQEKVVTATDSSVTHNTSTKQAYGSVDYAYLRQQVTIQQVLEQLGYFDQFHGRGPERRGSCPFHTPQREGSTSFTVNLQKHVFRCTNPQCGVQGNALDFWRYVRRLSLYDAAIDLAETFHLQLQPTEKRQPVKLP